jgi:translation initiation factor IF-3
MNNKHFKKSNIPQKQDLHRTNVNIRVPQVRLIGENIESAVYNTSEALKIAQSMGLDLIEINPKAVPPICKVADYQKFLYEQRMREKEQAKKQRETNKELKEVRFTANTDEGDIETKKKKIIEFLEKGHKVKTIIQFKGREVTHADRGRILLLKLATEIEAVGKPEYLPKLEGKNMHMMIAPKK